MQIPRISKILARKNETKELISDTLMEIESPRNFEKGGDQLSVPEQLVMDGDESSENTELGGGVTLSCMLGAKLPQMN